MSGLFAEVVLPVAQKSCYTYAVPDDLLDFLKVGQRVIVSLGKSLKSGIVISLHNQKPNYETKEIYSIWDDSEIFVSESQLQLWRWMASYYMCELGEVMAAALPSACRMESESLVSLQCDDYEFSSESEKKILSALSSNVITSVETLVGQDKTQLKLLNKLIEKGVVRRESSQKQRFRPQKKKILIPKEIISEEESKKLSELQSRVFSELQSLSAECAVVKADFVKRDGISLSSVNTLIKRGLITCEERIVDRHIFRFAKHRKELNVLSQEQKVALGSVREQFEEYPVVLLHGVTASGKTELYMHLIAEQLEKGHNVVYLLPEIALTTQLAERLALHFGASVLVYHSKYNDNERFEIWQKVAKSKAPYLIIGARSAVFLPFSDLGLIIVDEEHERSFKQQSPAPFYHGRDVAVYLGYLFGIKVLLGSGTPSMESYFNVYLKKYGLVELFTRYKGIEMPEVILADMTEPTRKKRMRGALTPMLYEEIKNTLSRGEQVILFQNRRGYAYFVRCEECGDVPQCPNCDVSLSLHKYSKMLKCHYCDFQMYVGNYTCASCQNTHFASIGMGTERLEEQLQELFTEYRVGRFDWDTTSGKYAYERLIKSFEEGEIDILVGTQMLAKGLDFQSVGLVGVLNADLLLNFPEFRAFEHSFQLLLQVSGRAGRKSQRGKVLIQSYKVEHPVLSMVKNYDYKSLYISQIRERNQFGYPPIFRMIKIVLKHKDSQSVEDTARELGELLKQRFGSRTYGATTPLVGRVGGSFIKEIIIKIERNSSYPKAKEIIKNVIKLLREDRRHKKVRILCNVDV